MRCRCSASTLRTCSYISLAAFAAILSEGKRVSFTSRTCLTDLNFNNKTTGKMCCWCKCSRAPSEMSRIPWRFFSPTLWTAATVKHSKCAPFRRYSTNTFSSRFFSMIDWGKRITSGSTWRYLRGNSWTNLSATQSERGPTISTGRFTWQSNRSTRT